MIRISIGRSFVRDNISQGGGADERTKKGVMRIDPFPVPLSLLFPLSPRYISILWGCNLILGRDLGRGNGWCEGEESRYWWWARPTEDGGGGRQLEREKWQNHPRLCRRSLQPAVVAAAAASPQLFMSSTLLSPRLALCWRVERGSLSPRLLLFSPFSLSGGDGRESGNGGSRGGRKDRRTDGELKRKRKKKELHLPYRSAAFALFYYCPRRLREKIDT